MKIWRTTTTTTIHLKVTQFIKIVKKKVKNEAHVSFLKKCIESGVVPKGLRINKNRYHSDLLTEIDHLNIALTKSELARQELDGKRIKKELFDEEENQTKAFYEIYEEAEKFKKSLRRQINMFEKQMMIKLKKTKNKKFEKLTDVENNNNVAKENLEKEINLGEFFIWAERTPKPHRRKLSTKAKLLKKKAKSKSKRKAKVGRNGQINDALEEEVEKARKPFTGHIGTGRVKHISDE
jgi:hypothetical protein